MNINLLVKLTSRAWSMDILALLSDGVAGRQAPLLAACDASRNAFGQSMDHLIDLGLVERNPGHGHPLRPEYRLTALGQRVGKACARIKDLSPDPAAAALLRRSWSIPVLTLSQTPCRFSDLRRSLDPITDRALTQTLRNLQDHNWMDRKIDTDARVIRPLYQAANAGQTIGQAMIA